MLEVSAVIGAAYGDEGKGLITDYLSAKKIAERKKVCVVRFNGGAQAGHTVTTPDGKRHVFHHIGSGAFAGASTFLSRFFVSNPMLLDKEHPPLKVPAVIYADAMSPVSTPYDMMLNQFLENQRAGKRHGSCGVGFNETLEREANMITGFRVGDLFNAIDGVNPKDNFEFSIKTLVDVYYRPRTLKLITDPELRHKALLVLDNKILVDAFYSACVRFTERVQMRTFNHVTEEHTLVFEGAQGLLLDQHHMNFPHVTRSSTGLPNVITLLEELETEYKIAVHYPTRAYSTRHGAGPFDFETALPYTIVDHTNVPNAFQGTLRFAPFNQPLYEAAVQHDVSKALELGTRLQGLDVVKVVTCVDQVAQEHEVLYVKNGEVVSCTGFKFEEQLVNDFNLLSFGPTRKDVVTKDVHKKHFMTRRELCK